MMRSLYSGVAGLKTHQTKMDVIGNNIANVNTTAYKSSSINFSDLMSQTTANASGANAATGTGGVNAKQIGLGVKTGAISMSITTQGSAQSTGNPFDIMITGDNFFVVNNGTSNYFTRDGSFYVDGAGNLAMTSTGYNVMGWQVDETTGEIKKDSVSALRIMSAANMTYPPEATTKAYMAGILDKNDVDVNSEAGKTVNLNVYDKLGYSYTARFVIKKSSSDGSYSVELSKLLDANGNEVDLSKAKNLFGTEGTVQKVNTTITFNNSGYAVTGKQLIQSPSSLSPVTYDLDKLISGDALKARDEIYDDTADPKVTVGEVIDLVAAAYGYEGSTDSFLKLQYTDSSVDPAVAYTMEQLLVNQAKGAEPSLSGVSQTTTDDSGNQIVTISSDGRLFDGSNLLFDNSTGVFINIDGANSSTLRLSNISANFEDIVVDFSDISMYNNNGTSTLAATSGDQKGLGSGRSLGDMIGVSIQNNGMIYASYDNGMTKLLGQIATASFANASGLQKEGDNLYSATMNSGEFDGIGVDVTANGGYMTTGVLEMSNVDLSTEFTSMITTQRGFQANSRIITVSDTLLEELTNLKR